MRRDLIPYYISRALLSAAFGWYLSLNANLWIGSLGGVVVYAGFIWYAHSGRYLVDPSTPLFPLRRDDRGRAARDRAVVASVAVAGLVFFAMSITARFFPIRNQIASLALVIGAVTYFVVSNWLFVRG